MAATVALAKRNRSAGKHTSPEVAVPDDATRIEVRLMRNEAGQAEVWADATQYVSVRLEVFLDGVWLDGGGFGAFGGRHTRRDGKPAPYSAYRVSLPAGTGRRARATLVCDAPLHTRVDIEVI